MTQSVTEAQRVLLEIRELAQTGEKGPIQEALRRVRALPEPSNVGERDIHAYLMFDVGVGLERLDDLAEAESIYGRILDLPCPTPSLRSATWFRLGLCRERLGSMDRALFAYQKAAADSQEWPETHAHVHYRLGRLLLERGEYELALKPLAVAKQLVPVAGLKADQVEEPFERALVLAGRAEGDLSALAEEAPLVSHFLYRMRHAEMKLQWNVPIELVQGGRVLDIGCGTGAGVLAALELGADLAVGVDRSLEEFGSSPFADVTRQRGHNLNRCLLIEGDIFEYSFGPPGFDVVQMLDVIEHVPDPPAFIRYAHSVLRDGGVLLLDTCPLYYSPIGHHSWNYFPKEQDPWIHLYRDADQVFWNGPFSEWHHTRVEELNKVTHRQVKEAVLSAGFTIMTEHESKPTAEDLVLYEKVKQRIDHSLVPEQADLFRDWIMIVARK